jgi:hypothetical protein
LKKTNSIDENKLARKESIMQRGFDKGKDFYIETKVTNWWVPDDVFLDSLPVGGTGKVQKGYLRNQYGGVFSCPFACVARPFSSWQVPLPRQRPLPLARPKRRGQRALGFQPLQVERLDLGRGAAQFALGKGHVQQRAQSKQKAQPAPDEDAAAALRHAVLRGGTCRNDSTFSCTMMRSPRNRAKSGSTFATCR